MVEQNADALLAGAAEQDVAFLVVGDPLGYVFVVVIALPYFDFMKVIFCIPLTKPFFQSNNTHRPHSESCRALYSI